MTMPMLTLASTSATRRAMLDGAGVPHHAVASGLDEDGAKASLKSAGLAPRDFADALAELKALRAASRGTSGLVLGSDSIVVLDGDEILDKPADRADAAGHLRRMSGRHHDIISAAVIVEGGRPVWRHVGRTRMRVRSLSEGFIDAYLDREWPAIAGCVGCYRVEAMGAQLFARIDGDHFTVLGMPLLPLLDYLRVRGVLTP